jgi:hypothetical protein
MWMSHNQTNVYIGQNPFPASSNIWESRFDFGLSTHTQLYQLTFSIFTPFFPHSFLIDITYTDDLQRLRSNVSSSTRSDDPDYRSGPSPSAKSRHPLQDVG